MIMARKTPRKILETFPLFNTMELVTSENDLKNSSTNKVMCPEKARKKINKSKFVITIFPSSTGPSNEYTINPQNFNTL
jgi:hypothetical protein